MDKASFMRLFGIVYDKFRIGMRNYTLSISNKDNYSDLEEEEEEEEEEDDNDNDNDEY